MNVIKLNAIDSTNDFLKALSQNNVLENFTVVTTNEQTKGKGQMGAAWISEPFKNLIVSVLIKDSITKIEDIFSLNVLIAVSVIEALKKLKIPDLNIKWPNDILAENKKIGGILIENTFKENGKIESIVGIGLNVNQTNFDNLPKASSLKNLMNQEYGLDDILEKIVAEIEKNVSHLSTDKAFYWNLYDSLLFKKGKATLFEDKNQHRFMGIIQGVDTNGSLLLLLEDDTIQTFGIKEAVMLY